MPSKTSKVDDPSSSSSASSSSVSSPPNNNGLSTSNQKVACENCRKLKIRCSGEKPCQQCDKRNRAEKCFFIPIRQRRSSKLKARSRARAKLVASAASSSRKKEEEEDEEDDEEEGGGRDDEMFEEEEDDEILSIDCSDSRYHQKNAAVGLRTDQSMISAERLLADDATAKILMDIFLRRIHPVTFSVASTSPSSVFENVLNRTMKASDAIQRDAGLAMACRMCGHEELGNLLVKRMEINYERVKEEPISKDAYSATAILATIMLSADARRGMEICGASFAMHHMLHPSNKDPVASTCEFLENLSLNDNQPGRPPLGIELADFVACNESNGMYNDWPSVTKEEITAHVQMATTQLMNWSQTLPDLPLRAFVAIFFEMKTRIATPSMRPALVMNFALFVDMHLLGCMIPPYIMEAMYRHDPENKFAMSALFKPCESLEEVLEPCDLNEEIAASLLRRVLVCRMLLFESGVNMDVMSSFLVPLEIVEVAIQLRSGNQQKARMVGEWIFEFIEHQDLNFWNPIIAQYVLMLGTFFFDMQDRIGLMRTIGVLDKLRRSQPTVVLGIAVLTELCSKMME